MSGVGSYGRVTLLIAIAARLTPLSSLLASGSARAFDFQVWRPLVFSLTTSSVISAVLTGLLLVLIGYQIEPMIGSVQFAFLYLLCGVGAVSYTHLTLPTIYSV